MRSKSEIISSLFLWYKKPSTLTLHHRNHSISQHSHVSFNLFVNQCLFLLYFLFSWNFFASLCRETHQEIVSLFLYNKLRSFLIFIPQDLISFRTYFPTFRWYSFKIYEIEQDIKSISFPERDDINKVEIERVMSFFG